MACGEKRKTLRRKMHMCLTVGHERPAALASISAKSLSGRASFMTLSTSLIGAPDNADSAATVSSNLPLLAYSQTAGSLMYSGALVDYRKYFMARPLTLALGGMHYGRYGRDSEDSRISPLFIGYANLIRGYDVGSFTVDECQITDTSSCAQFDSLIGSRMLISNI